jgi:ATP-binding cassette, subfamily B, bacterial
MLTVHKKHPILNYITIPISVSPILTILCLCNKIVVAVIPMMQTIITANFVNTVIGIYHHNVKKDTIYLPLITLISIILFTYVNGAVMGFVDVKIEIKLMEIFQLSVVKKRSKLDYWLIEHSDTWDLINQVCTDSSDHIKKGFVHILNAGTIIIQVISILTLLYYQVWWLSILMFLLFLPLFFVSIWSGKNNYNALKEANKFLRKAEYLRSVLQNRDSVEERSLFGYSKKINDKWYEAYESARIMERKAVTKSTFSGNLTGLATIMIAITLIGFLLIPLRTGALSIGMFIGLVPSIFNLVRSMSKQFAEITIDLANDSLYIKDYEKFMDLPETDGALDLPTLNMESPENLTIEFSNVTFSYPGTNHPVLKNLSMVLHPKRHYAFVGLNGAGKSTITKLLTGLYTDYTGEIFIGGKNLKEYKTSDLKGLFSTIYQDYAKYSIPFKDSIMLGNIRNKDDKDKLTEVIKTIDLSHVVEKLPNGLRSPIGKYSPDGIDLSGGEWQRIAIARTLVNDAKILILDEPTASLDPIAESSIYELFHQISFGKSAIFITHRLGAAKLADEILVITKGSVEEQGTHEELINLNGMYCNLYNEQRSWYQ